MLIYHFFDGSVKDKHETYEKLVQISINNDYARGNIFDFSYHPNIIKLLPYIYQDKQIQIFLSKLVLQENFIERYNSGVTVFFIAKKHQKIILSFSLDSFIVAK